MNNKGEHTKGTEIKEREIKRKKCQISNKNQ